MVPHRFCNTIEARVIPRILTYGRSSPTLCLPDPVERLFPNPVVGEARQQV